MAFSIELDWITLSNKSKWENWDLRMLLFRSWVHKAATTLGVWMAKCNDMEPCTIIMDLEGNDGRERGKDDTAFEKQIALFALAVSDIVLINMWCSAIGCEQAANKPLLRTIFQVMLQLFTPRKTTLMFVIRDKTDTPLEKLESLLREDTQKIWDDIPKPEAHKQTPLSDFFNIQVEALAHYKYQKEEFKDEVAILRKKFSKSIEAGGLAGDRRGVVPASGFSLSAQEIWKVIKENKDLDLPSHKAMVANIRCEEIANEEHSSFTANEEWLKLKELVKSNLVPGFGKKVSSLLGNSLSSYDKEATYFEESSKNAKRKLLEEKLLHLVQPSYQSMLEHMISGTSKNFKNAFTDALNEGKGFASAARDCTEKFMTLFDEQYQDAFIEQGNWNSSKERDKFSSDLDSHITEVRNTKLSELTALNKSKLEKALNGPVEALLKRGTDETWSRIRAHLHRETEVGVSEFSFALSGFEIDEQAEEIMISNLKDHAIGIIERKAREEAAKVSTYVKDRFINTFNYDNDLMIRVWTNGEDIPAITTTARSSCLKLLCVLAAIRLNEDTDTIWDMLDKALGKPDGDQDILATTTWEKVPESKTLIPPFECISVWNQLQRETKYTITQAIASQEQYNRNMEERKEQEQKELDRNKREENERKERERIERERNDRDERERKEWERIEQERIKREENERKERERIEQERIKREEKERNERELREQERNEREERERNERNERERIERERNEQLLKELNERMEQERIERQQEREREREERNRPRAPPDILGVIEAVVPFVAI
ncbi:protein ROOT HAIR DEFECTIVE 3 [Artemisia annua]|uniref:Protein ROOT HAIR DEFECTIVE 3 n=1 Tax=Artemisia annua TaxID=35608 RepID=A0A2U1LW82_ARTAN|nr:protein ROOT HAIR DEFECTIVE 3 [Artemisia annua]